MLVIVFIEDVIRLSETEKDPQSLFRTLCYTRFHLQIINQKDGLTTEMGKNVSELLYVIDGKATLI